MNPNKHLSPGFVSTQEAFKEQYAQILPAIRVTPGMYQNRVPARPGHFIPRKSEPAQAGFYAEATIEVPAAKMPAVTTFASADTDSVTAVPKRTRGRAVENPVPVYVPGASRLGNTLEIPGFRPAWQREAPYQSPTVEVPVIGMQWRHTVQFLEHRKQLQMEAAKGRIGAKIGLIISQLLGTDVPRHQVTPKRTYRQSV